MKIGDMVKFVDGKIIGSLSAPNAPDVIQVLWLPARKPTPARIDRLEVISEGR